MARSVIIFSLLLAIYMEAAISVLAHADGNPPAIFVFGDSLSDVGVNNALRDAYHANHAHYGVDFPGGVATGRFTNGYNFIDIMAQHMGFKQSPPPYNAFVLKAGDASNGLNFASGGSGILVDCKEGNAKKCLTMDEQIRNFKHVRALLQRARGRRASAELLSRSIFIFTGGTNDLDDFFRDHFLLLPLAPIDKYVANMTKTFGDQLKELYDLGARKFAILNVPAIGRIPQTTVLDFLSIIGIHYFQDTMNGFVEKFNEAESRLLGKLSTILPGMKYSIGNAYAALMDVTSNPEKHGMKNITSPCCGEVHFDPALVPPINITACSPTSWLCSNRSEYVFWDSIHRTQAVIQYAGRLFYSGNPFYADPINLKQLVEYESSGRGVLRGLGALEAMY